MTWPGEGLLIKLWETLAERGVGGLLKPWQLRRESLAQIKIRQTELVALADAEREAEDIRAGRIKLTDSRYALALHSNQAQEIKKPAIQTQPIPHLEISTAAVIGDALRREVNVAKAITHAEADLKDDQQTPPSKSIDPDWLYRWRDYAGSVSQEELQSIWGRILAGELKSPGSHSYRTLEFIRNLSTEEAAQIANLSKFVISNFIARKQSKFLDAAGLNFASLLDLQNLGLISGVEAVGLTIQLDSTKPDSFLNPLCSHGKVLLVRHPDPKKEVTLEIYTVTQLGRQVFRLGKFLPHEEYLLAVGADLKKGGVSVSIADYVDIEMKRIRFSNERPL